MLYAEHEADVAGLAAAMQEGDGSVTREDLELAVALSFKYHVKLQRQRLSQARRRLETAEQRWRDRVDQQDQLVRNRVRRLLLRADGERTGSSVRNVVKSASPRNEDKEPNNNDVNEELRAILNSAIKSVQNELTRAEKSSRNSIGQQFCCHRT